MAVSALDNHPSIKYDNYIYSYNIYVFSKLLYGHTAIAMMPANHPLATHITMFVDVLFNQGTPEQIEKFAKPAANCNIIGTYAQTELAHGTNVRGIETRADYDRKTDEFVLNTPNVQAYKWWPGGCECMQITLK